MRRRLAACLLAGWEVVVQARSGGRKNFKFDAFIIRARTLVAEINITADIHRDDINIYSYEACGVFEEAFLTTCTTDAYWTDG
jgi:hypothetical protein